VYAPKRDNQSIQPYFSALLVLSFVASVFLVSFVTLCCFEEKSIRTNLTRQGFILFHVSQQVSVRTLWVHRGELGARVWRKFEGPVVPLPMDQTPKWSEDRQV
jgi:hypothetical protein